MIPVPPERDCKNNGKNPGETGSLNRANLMMIFVTQEASTLPRDGKTRDYFRRLLIPRSS